MSANFESRKGKKERWLMAYGSEIWIGHDQLLIIDMVYEYMLKMRKKKKRMTAAEISRGIGKRPNSVSNALIRLAFKEPPYVRIIADKFITDDGRVFVTQKFEIVREAEQ